MRKLFSLLLCLALCLGAAASAEEAKSEAFTSGAFRYILRNDGTAKIISYSSEEKTLTIPTELDGHPVTALGDFAIGDEGFGDLIVLDNEELTSVTIPDSVTELGVNPFGGCINLETINVSPDHPTLAVIDGVLFSKPDKRLICYPTAMAGDAYAIPQGIRIIGKAAFYLSDLTAVSIPDSVTEIEGNPFYCCYMLTTFTLPLTQPYLTVMDGVLFSKPDKRLVCYPLGLEAETYTVPQGTEIIGEKAFYVKHMTGVVLPDSVTAIADEAFAFTGIASVSIPDSVTAIGDNAFFWSDLASVSIPGSLNKIGAYAFEYCSDLTEIILPDGIVQIPEGMFCDCNRLVSVTIPDSVTAIGENAFFNCDGLASLVIPDSVTAIGDKAFSDCDGLTSLVIPDSVTAIGENAFSDCDALTSLVIPDSVTEIGNNAFSNCDGLTVTVNRGSYAAQYCKDSGVKYQYPDSLDWLND